MRSMPFRFLSCFTLLALLSPLIAQEKDKPQTASGQVKVGVHKYKLNAGKLYQLKVDGEGFSPQVNLRPGWFAFSETLNQGDTFQAYILPTETKEHRITILPSAYGDDLDDKTFDYKVSLTPIPLAEKAVLEEKGKLAETDPVYNNANGGEKKPHKAIPIQLKARQVYIISLKSNTKEYDPLLLLEGPGGTIVASNDDGGGDGTNSRLFFQTRRNGEHKIIVTTSSKEVGEFVLTVQTTDK